MQSLYGAIANYKLNYMENKSKGLGDTIAKITKATGNFGIPGFKWPF